MDEALRVSLVKLVRRKFVGFWDAAEDIVHESYLKLRESRGFDEGKVNYGYLSVACVRTAYRRYMARGREVFMDDWAGLVDETDVAEEIIRSEDAGAVLESLRVLREIERVVVTQRYYGDYSFAEIARVNGLKLNTVLSHHRRALAKLRPQLTNILGYGRDQYYEQENI
jgi:RNA polymerase sigma factor (sigma-70 family)